MTNRFTKKESLTMRQTSRLSLLAGAAIAAIPTSSALAEGQAWSNSDEVRALVSEMIADSETRSSMLQSGATAGHDGKFFLASSDGNYRLNVGGQIQFRYLMDFRDDADGNNDTITENDFENGFQTRRTKLWFSGNVVDPNLFYRIQGNFDFDGSGSFNLEDAYVGYDFNEGWSLRWGQFKLPFLREYLVSSAHQLAVERSEVSDVFQQGRAQGVELEYKGESFKWDLSVSDGFNSANSDFTTPRLVSGNFLPAGGEAEWAFTTRFEFLFAGDWDAFKDFTSPAGADFGMMLGVAGHIEGGDSDNSSFSTDDWMYYAWTADLSFEGDGWNAFIAFNGSYTSYDGVPDGLGGTNDLDYDDYGLVAQFGLLIPNTDWEPYIRYSLLMPSSDRGNDDDFSTLAFGVNYYMHGHAAKFSADVVYYIDSINELGTPDTGIPYLGDDDDGEIAIRVQWQLLF